MARRVPAPPGAVGKELRLVGPGLIGAGIVTFVAVGVYAQDHAHVPVWLRVVPVVTFLAGCVTTVIGTLPSEE